MFLVVLMIWFELEALRRRLIPDIIIRVASIAIGIIILSLILGHQRLGCARAGILPLVPILGCGLATAGWPRRLVARSGASTQSLALLLCVLGLTGIVLKLNALLEKCPMKTRDRHLRL